MSFSLNQMDQVLTNAMGSVPIIMGAVKLYYYLTKPSAGVVTPQISSRAEKDELPSVIVAHITIPKGVKAVCVDMHGLNAEVIVIPKQRVKVNYAGGAIDCSTFSAISVSVSGDGASLRHETLKYFEIERLDDQDNTPYIVPFYIRSGKKSTGVLANMTTYDGCLIHLCVRLPMFSVPNIHSVLRDVSGCEDDYTTYEVHSDSEVAGTKDSGCITCVVVPSHRCVVEVRVGGSDSWNLGPIFVVGQYIVRVAVGGGSPLVIRDIKLMRGCKSVYIFVRQVKTAKKE